MKKIIRTLITMLFVAVPAIGVVSCSQTKVATNDKARFSKKVNDYMKRIDNSKNLSIDLNIQMSFLEDSDFLWTKIEMYFLDLENELTEKEWFLFLSLRQTTHVSIVNSDLSAPIKKNDTINEAIAKLRPNLGAKEWGIDLTFGGSNDLSVDSISFWIYKNNWNSI